MDKQTEQIDMCKLTTGYETNKAVLQTAKNAQQQFQSLSSPATQQKVAKHDILDMVEAFAVDLISELGAADREAEEEREKNKMLVEENSILRKKLNDQNIR